MEKIITENIQVFEDEELMYDIDELLQFIDEDRHNYSVKKYNLNVHDTNLPIRVTFYKENAVPPCRRGIFYPNKMCINLYVYADTNITDLRTTLCHELTHYMDYQNEHINSLNDFGNIAKMENPIIRRLYNNLWVQTERNAYQTDVLKDSTFISKYIKMLRGNIQKAHDISEDDPSWISLQKFLVNKGSKQIKDTTTPSGVKSYFIRTSEKRLNDVIEHFLRNYGKYNDVNEIKYVCNDKVINEFTFKELLKVSLKENTNIISELKEKVSTDTLKFLMLEQFVNKTIQLNERYIGDLYHFTDLYAAYEIIHDNQIKDGYYPEDIIDSRVVNFTYPEYGVCLTRQNKFKNFECNITVRFTLDGEKMATSLRNSKMYPLSYDGNGKNGEAEERLYNVPIAPLDKYCKEIAIVVNDLSKNSTDRYDLWDFLCGDDDFIENIKQICNIDETSDLSAEDVTRINQTIINLITSDERFGGMVNVKYKHQPMISENTEQEITAYHGSMKDFNNFDSSFMGSGEGAQIYGWGHYVTSSPELGQYYAFNALISNHAKGNKESFKYDGDTYYPSMEYQVEIPEDKVNNYIWWNEDRNEILLWIIERLRGIVDNNILDIAVKGVNNNNGLIKNFKTFGSLYHFLVKQLKTPKNASLALSTAGFTGIKVYGGSNPSPIVGLIKRMLNWPPSTKIINYVIFKDEDIKIVNKQPIDWRNSCKFSFGGDKGFGWKSVIKDKNKFIPNNRDVFVKNETINENVNTELTAYHGSGADFDRFDHSFMGTGEGAQAFGWGTYVTTDRGTAKYYARVASDGGNGTTYFCNGEKIEKEVFIPLQVAVNKLNTTNPLEIANELQSVISRNQQTLKIKQGKLSSIEENKILERIENNQKALEYIKTHGNAPIEKVNSVKSGQIIYEVDIPDDNGENYIPWKNTPRNIINNILTNLTYLQHTNILTFESIYELNTKQDKIVTPKKLSMDLSNLGYIGIKVPTGYLSGENGKGFNYVIFKENDVEIVEKYDLLESEENESLVDKDEYMIGSEGAVGDRNMNYSHVITEGYQGETMNVYHGSHRDFERFSISDKYFKMGNIFGKGVYTTTSIRFAKSHVRDEHIRQCDGFIYELAIPIDNERNYLDNSKMIPKMVLFKLLTKFSKYALKKGVFKTLWKEFFEMSELNFREFMDALCYAFNQKSQILSHVLRGMGYYGVKIPHENNTWYVVFYPEDVKIIKKHIVKFDPETLNQTIISENAETEIKAFHGSSHNFDKFNHKKYLSSGAGSQSFGWGTYVTDNFQIATDYSEIKHKDYTAIIIDGKVCKNVDEYIDYLFETLPKKIKEKYPSYHTAFFDDINEEWWYGLCEQIGYKILKAANYKHIEKFKEKHYQAYKYFDEKENFGPAFFSLLCYESANIDLKDLHVDNQSVVYEVDIPEDDGFNYISWYDKWLPEQLDAFKNTISKLYKRYDKSTPLRMINLSLQRDSGWKTHYFGDLYEDMVSTFYDNAKAISLILMQCGFVGIKYPIGTRWSTDETGTNYVIFDANNVKIVKKQLNEMQAFHGSGAQFKQFDSTFNGSGEGSASFGPGHYFTSSKRIGKDYANEHGTSRNEISKFQYGCYTSIQDVIAMIKSELCNLYTMDELYADYGKIYDSLTDEAVKIYDECKTSDQLIRKIIQLRIRNWKRRDPHFKEDYDEYYKDSIESLRERLKQEIKNKSRSLYQVEIPDEDKYAHWNDEVPNEWYDYISDLIEKEENSEDLFRKVNTNIEQYSENEDCVSVRDLYLSLNNMAHNGDIGTNIFKNCLKHFGYVGVKYPSGQNYCTSSTKEGDMNYTVFDDNNIKITNRWDY